MTQLITLTIFSPSLIAGCVSFHTRSASFDSILTSTSYGTEQQYLAHSNSMDSLLHKGHSKSTAVQSKGQLSLRKKKENGRVYNTLIDSESVMGTITYTPPDSDHEFTQSLPDSFKNKYSGDEIDTSIRERSHSQSVTKVSDILLSESKCGDRCDRKSADTTDTFNPVSNSNLINVQCFHHDIFGQWMCMGRNGKLEACVKVFFHLGFRRGQKNSLSLLY